MNSLLKVIAFLFVILYVLSPVDACPGPLDDLLVLLFLSSLYGKPY